MEFKFGDTVKALENDQYSITVRGWEGTVVSVEADYIYVVGPGLSTKAKVLKHFFKVIKSKEKNMSIDTSITSKLASFLRTEPEKGLMEANVITKVDGEYRFTQAGWDVMKSILLDEYKDKLRDMVAPIVDEQRKAKK